MKKILIVFGTRPEAIKMVPLVKEFQKFPKKFELKVCVTAQHRQMLDQVLLLFDIKPDFDLNIMAPNQDLFDITTKVLLGLKDILLAFKPDLLLVHGDTTTSMAACLAAFYLKINVGHVEAGLRTYNINSPWPEEMNRQVTDKMCQYYFAPTMLSRQNLLDEKINGEKIHITGNTGIDTLFMTTSMIKTTNGLENRINEEIKSKGYSITGRKYLLITGHRRENFGEGFLNICKALKDIALQYPTVDLVYPVHLNPNVQKPVFTLLKNTQNIFLISPLDYLPFVFLMQKSHLILTDSGGIQEEAPSLGKPVLVMRDTTERPEAITSGTAIIVGTDFKKIVSSVVKILDNKDLYSKMAEAHNPYGNGEASRRIVSILS